MLRSLMFVPAKEKMLQKIPNFDADAIIIDIEDSIEQYDKKDALSRVEQYLCEHNNSQRIIVRLNSNNYIEEATILSKIKNIGFMLPKFENVNSFIVCENIWHNHFTIALIETPLGIVNIKSIASCNWIDAVAFGAEDYTCIANMENCTETLYFHKNYINTFCKAYNKLSFDTPSFSLNDFEQFKNEVDSSVSLGFDGKLLIHPKHIEYINNAFIKKDVSTLERIVKQYEESGKAVLVIEGKVYEKMHINRLKKIIQEHNNYDSNRKKSNSETY